MLKFIGYKVQSSSFSLTAEIEPNKNYKIAPRLSCSVKKSLNRLIVIFSAELSRGEDPIPFEFKVTSTGTFSLDAGDDPNAFVMKAADATYPFLRQTVGQITGMSGIPPYMLPMIDVETILNSKNASTPVPANFS